MYLERAAFSFGSEDFVAAYLHLEKIFSLLFDKCLVAPSECCYIHMNFAVLK